MAVASFAVSLRTLKVPSSTTKNCVGSAKVIRLGGAGGFGFEQSCYEFMRGKEEREKFPTVR